jgi:protein phosphatase
MVVEQLKQQYNFSFKKLSVKGNREVNEDRIHIINEGDWQLLLLADGMGGYSNGEIAAELAIQSIKEHFLQSPNDAIVKINQVFVDANALINEKVSGAGTTLGGVLIRKNSLNIFWVGDVRIYVIELGESNTHFVTKDHNLAQLMKDSHVVINPSEIDRLRNTVTRSLGVSSAAFLPDSLSLNFSGNFKGLICSDGVHGLFNDNEIFALLSQGDDTLIVNKLKERVLKKGSDNASFILFSCY